MTAQQLIGLTLQLSMADFAGAIMTFRLNALDEPVRAHLKIAQTQTTTLRNCELLAKMVVLELRRGCKEAVCPADLWP